MVGESALEGLRRRIGLEDALLGIVARPESADRLKPALETVLTDLGRAHRIADTARLTGYGPFEFARRFKEAAGMSFHEFVDRARVDAAVLSLATSVDSTEAIAKAFGFMGRITLDLSIGEYTGLPLAAVLSLLRP